MSEPDCLFRPVRFFEVTIPGRDDLWGSITVVANKLGQQKLCTRSYDGTVSTNELIFGFTTHAKNKPGIYRVEVIMDEGTRVYDDARARSISDGMEKIVQIAATAHVNPKVRGGLKKED